MKRFLGLILAVVLTMSLIPVRVQAKTGGKLVALTFDDGPDSKYTKQLLDGLKERNVPVTFFVLGKNAKSNRQLIKRAYEEGHEIASHTWNHPNLTKCNDSEIKNQIEDTFEELDRACGNEADYLVRPPYGSTNQRVRNAINAPLVCWSVDPEDWSLRNAGKVRRKIVADAYDGCIILCHDIHKTTIPGALGAIDDLMDLGYEFVTVSELYRRRGRQLEPHILYYNSNKNGTDYGPIPTPQITVSGDASGRNTVTITCTDKKVPLYYTLDGSYPNQDAKRYTGPFTVSYGTKITAVAAYKLNGSRSKLSVKTADSIRIVAPAITLDNNRRVVMSTPTVGSKIYYTTNNTKPGTGSHRYSGAATIPGPHHLRAVTIHEKGVSAETRAFVSREGNLYYDMHDGQWFYDAMDWAYRNGVIHGTADYTMDPDGVVTRGMLVTFLYRFSGYRLGKDWKKTNLFTDVKQNQYYAEAIEWAYRNKIVDGYSKNTFGPGDLVTRQQMCKIVNAFLTWSRTPLLPGESCQGMFEDYRQVASWAVESVNAMVSAGLIEGDGARLKPNDSTSRAEFCTVLARVSSYINNYTAPKSKLAEFSEPV